MADPQTDEERVDEASRIEAVRIAEAERIAIQTDARATAIAGLQSVADRQNQNIELLTASVNALSRAVEHRPTRRETFNLVGVMQVVTIFSVFILALFVRAGQNQIADCVNENGKCAQRQAAKTADVVQSLNFTAIYTAACVQEGTKPDDLESCVLDKLTVRLEIERAKASAALND